MDTAEIVVRVVKRNRVPVKLIKKKKLRWQALYVVITSDLHSTAEYAVVREHAATPVDLPVDLSLCIDGERNEPRSFILSLEPTVGHHTLIVFPLAGKFVMLRHAEDVGILIGPDFAVTTDCHNLVDCEEYKVGD